MEKWNKRCVNEPPPAAATPSHKLPRHFRRWASCRPPGTELSYFKSQKDADQQKTAAGMLPCKGAKVFLKEVKGKTFRFTIVADKRTQMWIDALSPIRAVDAAADRLLQMWIDALSPIADVSEEAAPLSSRPSDMQSRVSVGDTDDSAGRWRGGQELLPSRYVGALRFRGQDRCAAPRWRMAPATARGAPAPRSPQSRRHRRGRAHRRLRLSNRRGRRRPVRVRVGPSRPSPKP